MSKKTVYQVDSKTSVAVRLVSLKQDGDDVNIMVDGEVIGWLSPDNGFVYMGSAFEMLQLKGPTKN